jgi:hypothetical protein
MKQDILKLHNLPSLVNIPRVLTRETSTTILIVALIDEVVLETCGTA